MDCASFFSRRISVCAFYDLETQAEQNKDQLRSKKLKMKL